MYTIFGFYKFKKIKSLKKYQLLFQREISAISEIAHIATLTGHNLPRKEITKTENTFVWDNRWVISIKSNKNYSTAKIGRVTRDT